ncbi:HD domain-containing phosphohydrolase [Marinitoga sp. 1135]|uniref:HD domain-containing phosphohydrolase n=1 Tax=Marinitoga sp. 1135 TaxID=1643333 RepID=UPI001585EDE6|nr:HD domain-containing phosphohydrolase [Marinitoga sp. 1135]
MKRLLIFVLIIVSISLSFSKTLKIGIYKDIPIVFDEKRGFFVELARNMFEDLNVDYKFVFDTQANLIEKLKNNEIDIVADLAITPERKKFFNFNSEALFFDWGVIYVSGKENVDNIVDLKNKKIGVMKTDIFYDGPGGIKEILKSFNIKVDFVEMNDYMEILDALEKHEIDAGVMPKFLGLYLENKHNIKKTSIIFTPISIYMMYKKDKSLDEFFQRFDQLLKKLKSDPDSYYYSIFDKYFNTKTLEKIPDWLVPAIAILETILIFIIIVLYINSNQLKRKLQKKNSELTDALNDLEKTLSELKNSTDLIEKIVNLSPNPIYIKTVDQTIIFSNKAFAEFFNMEKDEIIGKNLNDIIGNTIDEKTKENAVIKDIQIILNHIEKTVLEVKMKKDGKIRYFRVFKTPIRQQNGEDKILVLYIDVTDKVEQKLELEKKNKILDSTNKKLFKMIELISNFETQDIENYYTNLLKFANELVDACDYGSISLAENDKWNFIAAIGHDIEKLKQLNLKKDWMVQTNDEIKIFKSDELIKIDKKGMDEKTFNKFINAVKNIKEIMIITSELEKGKILNLALDIDASNPKSFTEYDKTIIQALMNIAKTVINSKYTIDRVKSAYLNFANKLALIAEAHDDITGQHIYRVGELSYFIAQKLNLTEDKIIEIKEFSTLHDIGKIFIPLEILNKPGKLTDEEYEIMKKHTIYAERLLGDDPYFETALKIALYHHEKYNGGGYPYNLKGDEIPIEAQIVSIVDVYDALRSKRPYKPAIPHEKVMKIIIEGDNRTSPKDFNPKILEIFKQYSDEINNIYNKFSD